MTLLVSGAMRRAMAHVQTGGLADATALIQRTLGQHGLMPGQMPAINAANVLDTYGSTDPHSTRKRFTCASGSRDYTIHVPDSATSAPRGLILMLHGCTQTPDDFAVGTAMNDQADGHGLIVVYPAQARGDNAQSCWNWFSGADQRQGRGEPAILAALTQDIAARYDVPGDSIFVAGLSAGAAMAVIMGQTYPDVFQGVGAHSGLPYGCARGVAEAFAAMSGQGNNRRSSTAQPTPTITFHGASDATVTGSNSVQIIRDTLAATPGQHIQLVSDGTTNRRKFTQTATFDAHRTPLAEEWQIDGLGHAWSGGNPGGSYADAQGPDASAEMIRFFLSLTSKDTQQ